MKNTINVIAAAIVAFLVLRLLGWLTVNDVLSGLLAGASAGLTVLAMNRFVK